MHFSFILISFKLLYTHTYTHTITQIQVTMEANTAFHDSQIKLGLVTAIISMFFLYKILSAKKQRYKLPPGPKGWPIIGNLYGMKTFWFQHRGSLINTNAHEFALIMQKQYIDGFSSEMTTRPYTVDLFDEYKQKFGDLFTIRLGNPLIFTQTLQTMTIYVF